MKTRNLAILMFEDVELLDFCGPYEVFSIANRSEPAVPVFEVYTVAEDLQPVRTHNGLLVVPQFQLSDCPDADLLLVPGGIGTRREVDNSSLVDWIQVTAARADLVLSVCTGALLLAKAGLLDDLEATTHHVAYELLRELAPSATVHEDRRMVDNGRVITSAGISAGIDMSFHVVSRLLGRKVAAETARHMEYSWQGDA